MHLLVNRDGQHLGPYSFDQACQLLAEGKLHSWDLCWPDGAREWVTLDTVPGVSDKAFALREQRRTETLATAQAASDSAPSTPNPQLVKNQPDATAQDNPNPEPSPASSSRGWMRLVVWFSLVLVIAASVVVWFKFLNEDTLIENLVRRADNLTYLREENEPFSGTAYGYFNDGTTWEEITFNNGQREGARTIWHINGEIALEESYSAGVLQSAISYDFNGFETGRLANGDGKIMLYYNSTGLRAQQLEYNNHLVVKRTIWNQDGQLLMVSPPEEGELTLPEVAPPPVVVGPVPVPVLVPTPPTTNSPPATNNPVYTITNLPPIIDNKPDPEHPGRLKVWAVGNLGDTSSRINVDRRIDLVFQQVSTNSVVKELGYPDYVDPNYWTYFNMKIRNLMIGGSFKTIHFQIFNGRVVRIIPVK